MSRWLVLAPVRAGRFDGIGDYAARLAEALDVTTATAVHVIGDAPLPNPEDVDAVLYQYSPAGLGQAAFRATDRWLEGVRRAGRPVVVTIHEYWPPPNGSMKRMLYRWYLRRAVRRAVSSASAVLVTQDVSARELTAAGIVGGRPLWVVPVGSNISPVAAPPGPREGGLILFGQPAAMHVGAMMALARWREASTAREPFTWLGRSSDELRHWWVHTARGRPGDVVCLGGLPEADISRHLNAATLGLAPYADGASARRTTLAALLQHGVPTLALDGCATDEWLRRAGGVAWVTEDAPDAFVSSLCGLLADSDRRDVLSREASATYAVHMSWPTIARAYTRALRGEAALRA